MRRAAGAVDNVDHASPQLVQRAGSNLERSFFPNLIGTDDFVIDGLHLLDEPCLIKRAAVSHDRDGLRHTPERPLRIVVGDSADWYRGKRGFLPPVAIQPRPSASA